MYVSSPNTIVRYRFANMMGSFDVSFEVLGENGFPNGWDGLAKDLYFAIDGDDALRAVSAVMYIADMLAEYGYDVDIDCSESPIGAYISVVDDLDNNTYTGHSLTGKRDIYDENLFDAPAHLEELEELPVAFEYDGWDISESANSAYM